MIQTPILDLNRFSIDQNPTLEDRRQRQTSALVKPVTINLN
uniref:Uncharacterized protein n=1 Tax=Tetranychus urticae TaxID=32264 RepID=T1KJW9_TETUR